MRYKFLAVAITAIIAIFALPVFVFADASPSTVSMDGEAIVIPGTRTTQIQMELKSNDALGWFINMSFSTPATERESDDRETEEIKYETISEGSNAIVRGDFSIGAEVLTLSSGTVDGTLNSNGTGDIKLLDQSNSTSLNIIFTITGSGAVTAMVEGQWPPIPFPASQVPPQSFSPPPSTSANITPVAPVPPGTTSAPAATIFPPQQPPNHFFWYLSRTSGIAAYILLFINFCLGIGLKTKYLDALWRRWRTFDLHQFTAILGGSLVILHIFSLLGDSYFKFTVSQLLVPMSSAYRPFWTALGTIGLYAGAVLALSFYIRKIIGQKTWRILHYMAFVLFFVILFHGIKAGTDSSIAWVQWLYISTGTVAAFLFLWRFLSYRISQAPKPDKIRIASLEQPDKNKVAS